MSRANEIYFEDGFDRPDGTDLGGNWQGTGNLQILNHAVWQGTSGASSIAELTQPGASAASELPPDIRVSAVLAARNDSTSPRAGLFLRRQSTTDFYLVALKWEDNAGTEKATLTIEKWIDGVKTELATKDVTTEVDTDSASYDGVLQRLAADIYDEDGAVVIRAYLNDSERPSLEHTDRTFPSIGALGDVGVRFEDNGTTGLVVLDWFAVQSLVDQVVDLETTPGYYNLGRLKRMARTRALRDSRASGLTDDYWTELINEANMEIHAALNGQAPWMERTIDVEVGAGQTAIELPEDVTLIGEQAWNASNWNVPIVGEAEHIQNSPINGTGRPVYFRLVGRGRNGGPVLRPYPTPAAAETWTFRVWRRPRFLVDDSDVPELRQDLCPALVAGAVMLYAQTDADRTRLAAASARWTYWLGRVRAAASKASNLTTKPVVTHAFARGVQRTGNWKVGDALRRLR